MKWVLGVAAAVLVAACGNGPTTATLPNTVDTVTLAALTGTPLSEPSAFELEGSAAVRTTETSLFDFAFDFDSAGRPVLLPAGMLDVVSDSVLLPGFKASELTFDKMVTGPPTGYTTSVPVAIDSGQRYYIRSRISGECTDVVPLYGKLEILGIDPVSRKVTMQILVDQNCDFHGLKPGLPKS